MEYQNFIDSSSFNDWQEIDVIVSRDCTLRCTYCYLQKSKDEFYDIEAILQNLDLTLQTTLAAGAKGVVLSFYPEPWVNISRSNELIARSLELLLKYPRFTQNYMIMIGTNGVNLHKPIPILETQLERLSLAVTIDGIKDQHDMYRVFANGAPSWDIVRKNILDNQEKYHIYSTKVTMGPDTLKYIYESSLFLWEEMHFKDVNMNVVFEDLWGSPSEKEKCLEVFEDQLVLLTDDIIKNERWDREQFQSLVGSRHIPFPGRNDQFNRTFCGATQMRSIDSDGEVYPCFRLSPYSLGGRNTFSINKKETLRALKLLDNFDAAPQACLDCELLTNCAMCVGGAYEESESLFWRTTHHCEFQKLQYKYAKKISAAMNKEEALPHAGT